MSNTVAREAAAIPVEADESNATRFVLYVTDAAKGSENAIIRRRHLKAPKTMRQAKKKARHHPMTTKMTMVQTAADCPRFPTRTKAQQVVPRS
ncbi:unnamed protein product [Discula destructiva]